MEAYGQLPLYFIENQGQLDPQVSYYIQGRDKSIYFTPAGVTFALRGPDAEALEEESPVSRISYRAGSRWTRGADEAARRWVVKLDFVGANGDVRPRGEEPTPAVISYFKGRREEWKAGLGTCASLVYEDLWPGIDLVYRGTVNRLKYTFLVHPGADPEQIRLAYRGAEVSLDQAGQLQVVTPAGGFQDDKPYAYQEDDGQRDEVAAAYVLEGEGAGEGQVYGFRLGAYDPSLPLVIDPAMLVYAGYIGGSGNDFGNGIAVDGAGNAYITGFTLSTEASFPATVGPDLTFNGGVFDAFVAKVNPGGTALVYAGYIGGAGFDRGFAIAVDGAGNAYVTGITESTEASFPVTVWPDLTFNDAAGPLRLGLGDAFVAKVNPGGTALVYAGYIGGARGDQGRGIAVDSAGNAYVTGITRSTEASFPATVGPDLTFNGPGGDAFVAAFVAKVNPGGTALVYAGYIGGARGDQGRGIAVDSAGNAYVTGFTSSTEASFPVTVGPDLTFNGGVFDADAFVAKVNPGGTALVYAGYIGGSGNDFGSGIAVDGAGNAYITGPTLSTEASFPATAGPDLTFNGGVFDAFVAKVNPGGTALVYAGYIGGAGDDKGRGIAVDSAGNAYVTGFTRSTEASFPVTVGPDLTFNGGGDAFVAKVAMPRASTITTVSAASFLGPLLTPNSIASGFGSNLATATEAATSVPLPTTLAGTTVTVTDTMGTARLAQLFFVSPGQINYLIPEGTAIGLATVTVTTADGSTLTGSVEIVVVAPGLFTANATGEGVAAAFYLRVAADGTRTQDLIFDPNTLASIPIDLGSEGDQIFLLLFGTGIRGFTSQVTATVGGENVPVLGAVPQGEFVGLDQVNIGPLPRSLAGRGEVDIILTTDGKQANTVTVNIE